MINRILTSNEIDLYNSNGYVYCKNLISKKIRQFRENNLSDVIYSNINKAI